MKAIIKVKNNSFDFLLDTKQRSKEKSYVLRLDRKKNQIESLNPLSGEPQFSFKRKAF